MADQTAQQMIDMAIGDASNLKLGLIPPVQHPLSGHPLLAAPGSSLRVPAEQHYAANVPYGDAYGNRKYGDCVEAAIAIFNQVVAQVGGHAWKPTEAMALEMYARITGFDPATGANDNGTDANAAMIEWRTGAGFGNHKATAVCAHQRWYLEQQLDLAINYYGGVLVGFMLPDTYIDQWNNHEPFHNVPGYPPNPKNGHMVSMNGYKMSTKKSKGALWGTTWGMRKQYDIDYIMANAFAVWVPLIPEWNTPSNYTPAGLAWSRTKTELSKLGVVI